VRALGGVDTGAGDEVGDCCCAAAAVDGAGDA